jgi:hypothetical protein
MAAACEMEIQGVQFDTAVGDKVTVNFDSVTRIST